MTSVDAYLARVRRGMRGMDRRVREDILKELRGHLAESTAANSGNVGLAVAGMGEPEKVGREYKSLYGYGLAYKVAFLAVAVAIAIPSVPVLGVTEEAIAPYSLSLPVLAALMAWLLWTGARAGSWVGLYAGIAACAARLITLGAVALIQPGAFAVAGGLVLFIVASLSLIPLAWIPGTARTAWRGPRAEL